VLRSETDSPRSGLFKFLKAAASANSEEESTTDFNDDSATSTSAAGSELEFNFNFIPTSDAFGLFISQDTYSRGNVTGTYQFTAANSFLIITFTETSQKNGEKLQVSCWWCYWL